MKPPRDRRGWDLALSLYEDVELPPLHHADFVHRRAGGKWDGIHDFFAEHPELLDAYDYFWLVDDDIETKPATVDALFSYVRAHHFELAQPALSLDSYYSHRITLQCPGFRHRHTNFVEIMAAVLARHVLRRMLPLFAETRSGLAIDWLWQQFVRHPESGIAIVDAYPVGHYRPLRLHLRGKMDKDGIDPDVERHVMIQRHGLTRIYAVASRGERLDGSRIESRFSMAWAATFSYWKHRHRIDKRPWTLRDFIVFGVLQMFSRPVR